MDKITCLIVGVVVGGCVVHHLQKKKENVCKCKKLEQEKIYKRECVLIPLNKNCKNH